MQELTLSMADSEIYGVMTLISASWHTGLQLISPPGFPASQQSAEMTHRKVKRDVLGKLGPKASHLDVLKKLEEVLQIWVTPPKDTQSSRSDRPLSLSAPAGSVRPAF